MRFVQATLLLLVSFLIPLGSAADEPRPVKNGLPLPGTTPLTMEGDIAAQMVDGVDRFLLREIEKAGERRARQWKADVASHEAYTRSLEPRRQRLAHILGLRDPRVPFAAPELVGTVTDGGVVGTGKNYKVYAVRWPVFRGVYGEGLLLDPTGGRTANVIAIPDADQTPEQIVGLQPGLPAQSQFARRLAESGCRVLVPALIDRTLEKRNGRANLTHREYLYRSAFELGRHLIGYEVAKVLAGVDAFSREEPGRKIGVIGYGEGGMMALYAGAVDPRIQSVGVSGYFGNRNHLWKEPLDRNVFGLLEEFGDAELAAMIAPRGLMIESGRFPEVNLPSQGGAPARLTDAPREEVAQEYDRARSLFKGLSPEPSFALIAHNSPLILSGSPTLSTFLDRIDARLAESLGDPVAATRKTFDTKERQLRQIHELDRHSQWLLSESPYVRQQFMKKLYDQTQGGGAPLTVAKYEEVQKQYRKIFAEDVIGRFDMTPLPMNPRSRKAYEADDWTGYEVVLDVFPDVFAYGILLLPKDLKEGEKRPVVVCQHGLEGRPQHVIGKEGYAYYKGFAAELARRGFITFAPQNLYIGQDRFRTLQRKANPIKKSLFSVIVPQHQQIVDWLKTLPNVDKERIAFYGLSYGGKTAMRVPALVTDYCLSICSADFNEWVCKNASTRAPYSYVWTGEYEIFEFDLGSTFNYAEMAALIAPRPFMVERGHFDGVAPDETVAYEFAKVRFLYEARLKLKGHCEIEWFDGPHTINGQGTYAFLHRHLKWPVK